MIKLYGHELSGNSYKIRLMLSLLKLEFEWIKVDVMKNEQKLTWIDRVKQLPGYIPMAGV